jgi:hypothetical protein
MVSVGGTVSIHRTSLAIVAALASLAVSGPASASPETRCEASKNRIAGAYYACRQKAEAASVLKVEAADFSRCDEKFGEKWDRAEEAGAGACPDAAATEEMRTFLTGQASVAAAVVAGPDGAPSCGDGSINVPGEQCDGTDVGGATCADLGYVAGALGCNSACRLDATSCDCPVGTKRVRGLCWALAGFGDSGELKTCDEVCGSVGLTCSEEGVQSVGSAGTDEDCQEIADVVRADYSPHGASFPFDATSCSAPSDGAIGCVVVPGIHTDPDYVTRFLHDGSATLCAADLDPSSCGAFTNILRRVCACTP